MIDDFEIDHHLLENFNTNIWRIHQGTKQKQKPPILQ
jgi:hypothetical protein